MWFFVWGVSQTWRCASSPWNWFKCLNSKLQSFFVSCLLFLFFGWMIFVGSETQAGRHASVSKRSFLPPKAMEPPRQQPWSVQRGEKHFWFGEKTTRVAVKLMIQKSSEQKLICYLLDLGLYHPNRIAGFSEASTVWIMGGNFLWIDDIPDFSTGSSLLERLRVLDTLHFSRLAIKVT